MKTSQPLTIVMQATCKKNPLAIAKTLELAWADKKASKLLIDLTNRIIEFAKRKGRIITS